MPFAPFERTVFTPDLHHERGEAIHFPGRLLDCFVAYAPGNDGLYVQRRSHIRLIATPARLGIYFGAFEGFTSSNCARRPPARRRAVAGVRFFSISVSKPFEMFVGLDAWRVRVIAAPRPANKLGTVTYADHQQEQFLAYSIRHRTISEAT